MTSIFIYGKGVSDVNSPYRLYRNEKFKDAFQLIPQDTFAPNVLLSGYAAYNKMRLFETAIPFKSRTTGEVSIKKWKLLKAAIKSWTQTVKFRYKIL